VEKKGDLRNKTFGSAVKKGNLRKKTFEKKK